MNYWVLVWALGCALTFWFQVYVYRKAEETIDAEDAALMAITSVIWPITLAFFGACWMVDPK